MQLSKQKLAKIRAHMGLVVPAERIFSLPERVLQFGTGVLLRGLPDYFIDKANRQHIFNGRIVVVKSTTQDGVDAFDRQDGLYTLCMRGIENGEFGEENIVISSISRVLSAASQWKDVLDCASDPNMQLIISNTTEVGIVLDAGDDIYASPPQSFPGKLLAFLFNRYLEFNGDPASGMVIIPTELIPGNGDALRSIVEQLAIINNMDVSFMDWLKNANYFCNSLVDRIVPGKPPLEMRTKMEEQNGYEDQLMVMSEMYRLWAIESSEQKVREILSFSKADSGVVISDDIDVFRELKLRLLNGAHTFSCGLAHLAGFVTVKEAMKDSGFVAFISKLMKEEIAPAITSKTITINDATSFAAMVLDRFRNPNIEHLWLSITMQYSSKMKTRNLPIILNFLQRFQSVPECISLGLAAHVLFMKCERGMDGKFYGEVNGKKYPVDDDQAGSYAEKWKKAATMASLVSSIYSDQSLWGLDLSQHHELINTITSKLQELTDKGAPAAVGKFSQPAKPAEII